MGQAADVKRRAAERDIILASDPSAPSEATKYMDKFMQEQNPADLSQDQMTTYTLARRVEEIARHIYIAYDESCGTLTAENMMEGIELDARFAYENLLRECPTNEIKSQPDEDARDLKISDLAKKMSKDFVDAMNQYATAYSASVSRPTHISVAP